MLLRQEKRGPYPIRDYNCLVDKFLLVMAGAAIGGAARYGLSSAIMARFSGKFPIGTVVVNITGCFLIGLLMPLFEDKFHLHQNWRLLLITGILGGYTTFSSFMWESYHAGTLGDRITGLANILLSVGAGYLAVWMGSALTRK